MGISSIALNKSTYAPGDIMELLVEYTTDPNSRVELPVELRVAGSLITGQVDAPASRLEVHDPSHIWLPGSNDGSDAYFRAVASESGTGSVQVRLLTIGATESRSAGYTVQANNPLPLVGWNQFNTASMMNRFPQTDIVGWFIDTGEAFPSWTSARMQSIPANVSISLRFKDPSLIGQPLETWLLAMPADRRAAIEAGEAFLFITYHHEPEQGTSQGDPDPATWRSRWASLLSYADGKPWRHLIKLTPIYTDWAMRNNADWEANWGVVAGYLGVDVFGTDIYNPGSSYRTPQTMFDPAIAKAASLGLPVLVAEWGRERKTPDVTNTADPNYPNGGAVCAERMQQDYDYAVASGRIIGLVWFWNGGDNLDNRLNEQAKMAELMSFR